MFIENAYVERLTGRKIKVLAGDRGYRGKREVNGTCPQEIRQPLSEIEKHKLFRKRASIEPSIGHLKSDYRLVRNFYKGVAGDAVNVLLAAAVYNFQSHEGSLVHCPKNPRDTVKGQYLAEMGFLRGDYIACVLH